MSDSSPRTSEERKDSSPPSNDEGKHTPPSPTREHEDLFDEADENSLVYKITKVMSYHPLKICSCMFFFILIVVAITVSLGVADISEASEYDWVIADTAESKNLDSLDDALTRIDLLAVSVTERSGVTDDKLYFVYESSGGDIYTPSNLHQMCVTESFVVTSSGFADVCHLTNDNCSAPSMSIVAYFYDFTMANEWNCTTLSDSQVNSKKETIYDGLLTPAGQQEYGVWLSKDAVQLGYSTLCNSIWDFGTPLKGYESQNDREEDQFEEYQKFLASLDGSVEGVEAKLFEYFDIESNAGGLFPYYPSPYMAEADASPTLRVRWFSVWNLQNEFVRLLSSDLNFAIFSILFVVLWLRVHTGSTLLALSGIFMIVMSVPFTILIYKKVFNIPFFSELHSLVLFIVLGVGADDIFVLADSWKLTRHLYPEDITNHRNPEVVHRRLFKCYRHTMATVFNTSFTTSMAFLATGLSPLMPISTFGWYAASCIVMNYIFVISFMPPVVIIAEMYCENSCMPCQEKVEQDAVLTPSIVVDSNENGEKDEGVDYKSVPNESGLELTTQEGARGNVVLGEAEEDEEMSKKVDELPKSSQGQEIQSDKKSSATDGHSGLSATLLGYYINTLEWSVTCHGYEIRVVAISFILGLLAFGIVGIIYGLQLEPPSSQETWFPDAHMMQQAQIMVTEDFLGVDEAAYAEISVTLGIAGIDRSDFNQYIPGKNRGTAKFDNSFELASPSCQKVLTRMCEDIPVYTCTADACRPTLLISRTNSTRCFMTDFRAWTVAEYGIDSYTMNQTFFYDRLEEFRKENAWQDEIGFVNGELKFATVSFTSTMEVEEPMKNKLDVKDTVEALVSHIHSYEECGPGACACDSIMYTSPYAFVWLQSEIGLVRGFYQGMYIAFPVAFCVLMFATGNYLISFYAISSVLFIVFGVLGFAKYGLGWDLGIAESIAGIIIIGFSVDYTVHLGHMFTDAETQLGVSDRKSKFEHSSREIVPTVVGGAITTAGAGSFMFFCQLLFFVKMAALIVCTIVLSYIYSLGFFMSVLLVFGPENDEGKIGPIIVWIKTKLNLREEENKVDPEKVKTVEEGEETA